MIKLYDLINYKVNHALMRREIVVKVEVNESRIIIYDKTKTKTKRKKLKDNRADRRSSLILLDVVVSINRMLIIVYFP